MFRLHTGLAVLFSVSLANTLSAQVRQPQASDIIATPIPAHGQQRLLNEDPFATDGFELAQSPLVNVLKPFGSCLAAKEALIIHFANWGGQVAAGPYQLSSSHWYVYHPIVKAHNCYLKKVISRTNNNGDDQPLLYGYKSAVLVGINTFSKLDADGHLSGSIPVAVSIVYKVSATPDVAENVQNFGMLVSALLGLGTAGGGVPQPSPMYMAVGVIEGYKRLPFGFNIGFSLILTPAQSGPSTGGPTPPTPLPDAYAGVPYSEHLPYNGGVGAKAYQLLAGNQPPSGLKLSSDGLLDGTPMGPGTSTFVVNVTDNSPSAHPVRVVYLINIKPKPDDVASLGGGGPPPAPSPKPGPSNPTNTGDNSKTSQPSPPVIDCSGVSDSSPCTFTRSFRSDDREAFDFSLSVPIPGVRETKYTISNNVAKPSVTRHTDLYAMLDLYPFAAWTDKRSAAPHVVVGLPVTGQPFYRPFFGLAENFTNWTGLRRRGFPLEMSVFGGLVDMRVQNPSTPTSGQPLVQLEAARVWKGMFGIEVSVSSLASKITGGGKNGGSQGKGQ